MGQTSSRLLRGRRSGSTADDASPSSSTPRTASSSSESHEPTSSTMTDPSSSSRKGKTRALQAEDPMVDGPTDAPLASMEQQQQYRISESASASASSTDATTAVTSSSSSSPRLFRKRSKRSSDVSDSTFVRPSGLYKRRTSSRSIGIAKPLDDYDGSDPLQSPSSERRSLGDKFRQRSFTSFVGPEDSCTSPACMPPIQPDEEAEETAQVASQPSKEPIPSTPTETPYVHAALPVTPPEEEDAILQERERVRQMIEAAGISLRPSSNDNAEPEAVSSGGDNPASPAVSESTPAVASTDQDAAYDSARSQSLDDRLLPRTPGVFVQQSPDTDAPQSASSPQASETFPSSSQAGSQAADTSSRSPSAMPTARPPGFGLPRRILVQGIVSRGPISRPASSSPVPARSTQLDSPVASPAPESDVAVGPDVGEPETSVPPGDSGFWSNLVEGALSPGENRSSEPREDIEDSGGSAWDEAVAELLALPDDSSSTSAEDSVPAESHDGTSINTFGIAQPGTIIGRLLGIAAASTAATLLPPGAIVINGQVVAGFDDNEDSAAVAMGGRRSRNSAARSRSASAGAYASHGSQRNSRSTNMSPTRFGHQGRRNSGSLQNILQDALANALARPPMSPPLTSPPLEAQVGSPALSPSLASDLTRDRPSAHLPVTTSSPVTSPIATPPLSRRPSGPATAMAIPIPDWIAGDSLAHGLAQPEGTFERFLADLQTNVVSSVLRYLIELDAGASPERFVFFRSFRFPSRPASSVSWERPPSASGIPALAQSDISPQGNASLDEAGRGNGSTAESLNGSSATAAPLSSTPDVANDTNVVPMLLVGVRSIARLANGSLDSELAGHTSDSENDEELDPASIPLPEDEEEGVEPAQVPLPVDADDLEFGESQSPDDMDTTAASESPAQPTRHFESGNNSHSGFVMWIMGGIYPENHPLVIAPNLLSDEALSYEEMLRLADILGSVKPPTATQEEIQKSALPVKKGFEIPNLAGDNEILALTADRCLVCLEDYEEDDDIRILQCKHCFHQPCVDRWLAEGANTCPACRTEGVKKEVQQQAAAASSVASAVQSTRQEA